MGRNDELLTFSLYEKIGDEPEVLLGEYGELWRLHERCKDFVQQRMEQVLDTWETPELGEHYVAIPKIRYRISTRQTKEGDFDLPKIERKPLTSEWITRKDFLAEIRPEKAPKKARTS